MTVPIHDNHFHCHPAGAAGMDAAKRFAAAGGTSIAHVRLPAYSTTPEAFERTCLDHVAFSQKIRDEAGLRVWSAVGPYPLEPLKLAEAKGWEHAEAFGRACYDIAARLCGDGQAHCIGEVGRPHFEVDSEAWDASNRLLEYGMAKAKDVGVPIMLHTEHAEPSTMLEFAQMADRAGLARDRVIKHYCGPLVNEDEHHGLVPSVIAGRSNIRKALAKHHGGRFLLETDYIDDADRPDAVMPCDTVPKRVSGLMQSGEIDEATAWSIGDEMPRRLYD